MSSKQGTTKWNEVSKELFQLSKKEYFRTAKQCRERWNNHLDPSKIKGFWKPEQCLLMLQYVREHGKKWANLVRILKRTRNEHSIKNKFNSIIKKYRKLQPSLQQSELYDQIIMRIKKSIENMAILDEEDISYDFDQFVDLDIKQKCEFQPQAQCHEITRNFQKILNNFNKIEAEFSQRQFVKHDQKSSTTIPDNQLGSFSATMRSIGQALYEDRKKLQREARTNESMQTSETYQAAAGGKFISGWPDMSHQFYGRNHFYYPTFYHSVRPYQELANLGLCPISSQYNNE